MGRRQRRDVLYAGMLPVLAVFLGLTEAQWVSAALASAALVWLGRSRDAAPSPRFLPAPGDEA